MTIDDVQYVKYQAIISLIEKYQETWDGVRRSSFCVSKACRVHMYTSCRTIEGKVFLHFLVVTKRNTVDFSLGHKPVHRFVSSLRAGLFGLKGNAVCLAETPLINVPTDFFRTPRNSITSIRANLLSRCLLRNGV